MLSKREPAQTNANWRLIFVLWVIGTSLSWILVQYAGIRLTITDGEIRTWSDVVRLSIALGLNGVVLGAVCGIVQGMSMLMWRGGARRWLAATLLGYTIGLPIGFLIPTVMTWNNARSWAPDFLTGRSLEILYFPTFLAMLFSGAVIAFVQWIIFFRSLPRLGTTEMMLWVWANALFWVVGFVVYSVEWSKPLPFAIRHGIAGGTIGLLTLGLTVFLQKASSRPITQSTVMSS